MKLLMLAVFLSVMQASPPVPRKAANNTAGTRGQTQAQAKPEQTAPNQSPPPLANTAQPPRHDADADEQASKNTSKSIRIGELPPVSVVPARKGWADWAYWGFNLLLVVVGAFQIWLLCRTLIFVRRQTHEMKRQRGFMRLQWKAMQGQLAALESSGRQTDEQIRLMQASGVHTESLAEQAVKQSNLTQRQLDLTNRPWIAIDFVEAASNLHFREDGCLEIHFRYQIRNVGHSVAQHVLPWIEPIITGIDNPIEARSRISEQLRKPVSSAFDHGKLIFPTQVIIDNYPVLIRPEKLTKALENSPFKQDGMPIKCIGIEIFICFDYQSTLDASKHHQTQSMYLIGYGDDKGRVMGAFHPDKKMYPLSQIVLTFKGYGAYAD